MKLTAEERRRVQKTRQHRITSARERVAHGSHRGERHRVASTAVAIAALIALAFSFVAASHAPAVSFGAHLFGAASLVDWLMPHAR